MDRSELPGKLRCLATLLQQLNAQTAAAAVMEAVNQLGAPPPPAEQASGEYVALLMREANSIREELDLFPAGDPRWRAAQERRIAALNAAIAALSQRPVIRVGSYGSAFDPPNTCRAFTYEHQPGNVLASRLGNATQAAASMSAGDSIDRGLGLLKALQDAGFGVYQLAPQQPTGEEG